MAEMDAVYIANLHLHLELIPVSFALLSLLIKLELYLKGAKQLAQGPR